MGREFRYNNGNEEKICTFVSHKHSTMKDIYTIRVRYSTKKRGWFAKKEEKVKTFTIMANKGSVQIDTDDKRKQILDSLIKNGILEFNSSNTEIDVQTLIEYNGELKTKEGLSKGPSNVKPQTTGRSNVRTQTPGSGQVGMQSLGKHYAISDIHGMYGSYMEAVRQLKENDTLFVIGDAIDRGKNGIKILKDIISRQKGGKKPRVVFLLGNHEKQMIDVLSAIRRYGLNKKQIEQIRCAGEDFVRVDNLNKSYNEAVEKQEKAGYMQKIQELQRNASGKLNPIPEGLKNDEEKVKLFYRWITTNVGEKTLEEYLQLSKKEQDEIYDFLTDKAFVQITKKIQNKKYCFVHAAPLNIPSWMDMFTKNESTGCTLSNMDKMLGPVSKKVIRDCLGLRKSKDEKLWTTAFRLWKENGFFTIYGHTPVREVNGIQKNVENGCICIDSGCSQAQNDKYFAYGKLALYCIDDETIKYIEPREEDRGTVQGDSSGR